MKQHKTDKQRLLKVRYKVSVKQLRKEWEEAILADIRGIAEALQNIQGLEEVIKNPPTKPIYRHKAKWIKPGHKDWSKGESESLFYRPDRVKLEGPVLCKDEFTYHWNDNSNKKGQG